MGRGDSIGHLCERGLPTGVSLRLSSSWGPQSLNLSLHGHIFRSPFLLSLLFWSWVGCLSKTGMCCLAAVSRVKLPKIRRVETTTMYTVNIGIIFGRNKGAKSSRHIVDH